MNPIVRLHFIFGHRVNRDHKVTQAITHRNVFPLVTSIRALIQQLERKVWAVASHHANPTKPGRASNSVIMEA